MRRDTRNDSLGDRTLWSRYEIKYRISESKAVAIAQFIKPYVRLDKYCYGLANNAYPIVSLYLDSQDLHLCRESLTGKKNRFKLRVRSYTDKLDYPRFFEIKRRVNTIIIKSRTEVMPDDAARLLSNPSIFKNNKSNDAILRQFAFYRASIKGRPVIRTRYMRQAFEGTVDDRVRITFDRNLAYNVTTTANVGLDGQGCQSIMPNQVILEIKFTGRYPAWLNQLVKHFDLQQRSLSKYAFSIKQSCLMGRCKLKIPV